MPLRHTDGRGGGGGGGGSTTFEWLIVPEGFLVGDELGVAGALRDIVGCADRVLDADALPPLGERVRDAEEEADSVPTLRVFVSLVCDCVSPLRVRANERVASSEREGVLCVSDVVAVCGRR